MIESNGGGSGDFAQSLIIKKFSALESAISDLITLSNEHRLEQAKELSEVKEEMVDKLNEVRLTVARLETQSEERGRQAGALTGGIVSLVVSVTVGLILWAVKTGAVG